MKQILKKGKVKGTVLFTTTGVMLVLVVFLMSTLVLATSSNRRSYYTYYESQAQYAAQAALDAIASSAYSDGAFYSWIVDSVTDALDPNTGEPTRYPITVDFARGSSSPTDTNGTRIQFTNETTNARGETVCPVECFVQRAGSNFVWDDVTQAVHEQRAWKITATASVGHGKNATEYSVVNYIYENFHLDDLSTIDTRTNIAENTVHNYSWDPDPPPIDTESGTLVDAISAIGRAGNNNNFTSLGPQSSGLSNFPVGRIRYDSADSGYTVQTINQNYAVGDVLYVNSLYSSVLRDVEFQRFGEHAIYYGNIYCSNKGNHGFHWSSHMSASEVGRYTNGVVPYNALPYVYVDGTIYLANEPANSPGLSGGGIYVGDHRDVDGYYPVNLYCGGVNTGSAANVAFGVWGDAYLYDPDIDSIICCGDFENNTALKCFVSNNVGKAATQWGDARKVGGNIICNNRSLTLGEAKTMTIDGDLIMTNKNSTLKITNTVTVTGKVVCAGNIQGRDQLVCNNIITSGSDAFEDQYDRAYRDRLGTDGYAAYINNGLAMPLMPFPYRLDEIFQEYKRWDLASADEETARNYIRSGERLISESNQAGHGWDVKRISKTNPQTNVTETTYVPYTSPVLENQWFVPSFNPVDPSDSVTRLLHQSSSCIDDEAAFDSQSTSVQNYDASNRPMQANVPVLYHDATGGVQTPTLNNAYVINENCTIDFTATNPTNSQPYYSKATFFIDPYKNGHSDRTSPLMIKLTGGTLDPSQITIVVNNTAIYSSDYESISSAYAEQDTVYYAGRREVYIFLQEGFQPKAQAFKLCTSGGYGQMQANSWRVVSNPIYPGQDGYADLSPELKYAYELVPNVKVFGQRFATYTFPNACFMNADVWMPTSTIENFNASNYQASAAYREYSNSSVYNAPTTSMIGVGSMLCDTLNSSPNVAMIAYIGDRNRNHTDEPGQREEILSPVYNSNDLGQENIDHFQDDHIGPT